jgi:hypothetical protein
MNSTSACRNYQPSECIDSSKDKIFAANSCGWLPKVASIPLKSSCLADWGPCRNRAARLVVGARADVTFEGWHKCPNPTRSLGKHSIMCEAVTAPRNGCLFRHSRSPKKSMLSYAVSIWLGGRRWSRNQRGRKRRPPALCNWSPTGPGSLRGLYRSLAGVKSIDSTLRCGGCPTVLGQATRSWTKGRRDGSQR